MKTTLSYLRVAILGAMVLLGVGGILLGMGGVAAASPSPEGESTPGQEELAGQEEQAGQKEQEEAREPVALGALLGGTGVPLRVVGGLADPAAARRVTSAGAAVSQASSAALAHFKKKERPLARSAASGLSSVAVKVAPRVPLKRRVSRKDPAPWVSVEMIQVPERISRKRSQRVDSSQHTLPVWDLFAERGRLEETDLAGEDSRSRPFALRSTELFEVREPELEGFGRALGRVVERKYQSEVRRFMKRQWREQFHATPTMAYATYLGGVERINQLGRGPQHDLGAAWQQSNEFKASILGQVDETWIDREGENDFSIFSLGPVVFMDSGSIRLDPGRIVGRRGTGRRQDLPDFLTEADLDRMRSRPILVTENYLVGTSIKLGVDPFKAVRYSDPTWTITRYGGSLDITFLSDVLGRETLRTEFDVVFQRGGDFAGFFNFVFNSRP